MIIALNERDEVTAKIDQERIERAAEVLKTVAHPVRLRIVELLEGGEKSVSEIKELLGVSQPLTSQHLSQMRMRGVLGSRRDGSQVYYSIANPDVVKVIHCIRRG
ncbi:MAG TPA: metalloregulator ArsR/SmtB family transcription factor [Candidatus Methanoperedens sp.]|nr:metalloregulator ArsR/SmtB family transcription factor [Candidatus Methanoperedens sp.]